jgi:hypothetical protein
LRGVEELNFSPVLNLVVQIGMLLLELGKLLAAAFYTIPLCHIMMKKISKILSMKVKMNYQQN